MGIVVFFAVGWALPWREALWGVVALAPVTQLGWWLCGDRCFLSIVEDRLRGGSWRRHALPEDENTAPNFVADLASRLLGRPISYRWANRVIYLVVWAGFAVAGARLAGGD